MGQFSIRGGIVDIFPLTEEVPVRIELWMMRWTPSAVSTRKASGLWNSWKKITIYPSAETILTKKQLEAGIERLEKEEKEYEAALRPNTRSKKHPVSGVLSKN